MHMEKSISWLFPGPRGDMVANDWCIKAKVIFFEIELYDSVENFIVIVWPIVVFFLP